jgi:hypothetical protein
MRTITATYAYHPSSDFKADLKVDTDIISKYEVGPLPHSRAIDPNLEQDIKINGIKRPLKIYTNGLVATLGDGNQRIRIARKLGIKKVPVQIVPDNFRRSATRSLGGHPRLAPVLVEWVEKNLWAHEEHRVTRHVIGGGVGGSIKANRFARCKCSCGAYWKEEA